MKTLLLIQKTFMRWRLFLELTTLTFAQTVLPEIVIRAANYKYLNAVSPEEASQPVDMAEQAAAAYDIKGRNFTRMSMTNILSLLSFRKEKFSLHTTKMANCCARRKDTTGWFTPGSKASSGKKISRMGHFHRCIPCELSG